MALLCVVTNCGEGMDFRAIGTVLSGVAQCGAWSCFDEFNRIEQSVLSVISTQLQTIRNALVAKVKTFFVSILPQIMKTRTETEVLHIQEKTN